MAQTSPASGFTLIEVLMAIAIVGLTTTLAVASYRGHLQRSHRIEAIQALLGIAAEQEKFYLAYGQYAARLDAAPGADPPGLRATSQTPRGRYRLAIEAADAVAYRVVAIAGSDRDDPRCVQIFIDESGRRGASDARGADSTAQCW